MDLPFGGVANFSSKGRIEPATPFWMSSTQWGASAAVWKKRPVSGGSWAAGAEGDFVTRAWFLLAVRKEKAKSTKRLAEAR